MLPAMPGDIVVTPADRAVDALIGVLARRGFTVIAPTVRDGAIVLDEVAGVADLPIGWSDEQEAATYRLHRNGSRSLFAYAVGPYSPRRYLSEPRRTLWSARRTDDGFELAGVDWYTAGTALEKLRAKGVDISQVPAQLPAKINQYFDDIFPAGQLASFLNNYEGLPCDPAQNQGGFDCNWSNAQAFLGYQTSNVGFFSGNDWTDVQAEMDLAFASGGSPLLFMQPQFGALSTWSSIGNSNYNALTVSYRQRLSSLTMDFNYTWAHSLDDASGEYRTWTSEDQFHFSVTR
jgi:hypothetical protein